ncbi:sulfotransferase domain-containing protein [Parerythrobacter jejuensis]|uniref:Sulfotransferase domain-containing protein n=1 Tax=Parerythrobacter jejuensis TaxID=795812 RepID=A0A845AS48_9SPHN|nr:sulfotransferase domain-containing protein [Parerythrobacter jejuensis]MXP32003.1 hypothetical protein [Parerythrobacter jejuensis]
MSAHIHWLASYPKSGNTWLRLVLSHLTAGADHQTTINDISGGSIASDRTWLDQALGFATADLLPDEIASIRPEVYRWSAQAADSGDFHKIHDACTRTPSGEWLPCPEASGPSIYLLRNPLDVTLSYAGHLGWSADRTIEALNSSGHAMVGGPKGGITPQVGQQLLNWSKHVESWVDNDAFTILAVRYEEMLAEPADTFARIAEHLGLSPSPAEIADAIEQTRFERLQEQESQTSFREKSSKSQKFFRKGQAGAWQTDLTDEQIEKIVTVHRPVMRRFGYCDDRGNARVM